MNLYENEDAFKSDSLFAGNEIPVLVKKVNLEPISSGVYVRGSVLMSTANGNVSLLDKNKLASTFSRDNTVVTETKGSTIIGILTDIAIVPTGGTTTTKANAYICGNFNKDVLTFESGTVSKDVELALREVGIFIN